MIFVTVGGGPYYGFDRLIKKMDDIAAKNRFKILMQTGCSAYVPKHSDYFRFDSMEKMLDHYKRADIVVAHASGAPTMYARDFSLPLVLVPRMPGFGEIFDDHQFKTAKRLEGESMIEIIYDIENTEEALIKSLAKKGKIWPSSHERKTVVTYIKEFVNKP